MRTLRELSRRRLRTTLTILGISDVGRIPVPALG
jgi:hypothetical protein